MNLNTSQQFHSIILNDKSYSRYLVFIMAEITTISTPILKIDNQPELSLTLWSKSNAQYNTYIKAMGKRPDNIITDKKITLNLIVSRKIFYIIRNNYWYKKDVIKNKMIIINDRIVVQQTNTKMLLIFITSKKISSRSRRLKYPQRTINAIPDIILDGVNTETISVFHF